MLRPTTVLLTIALAGCASYSEIQSLAPEVDFPTAKDPSGFVACVMPKARERWPNLATLGPDGSAQVITIAGDGYGTFATVTVTPAAAGSRVVYRTKTRAGRFTAFADDLASCA